MGCFTTSIFKDSRVVDYCKTPLQEHSSSIIPKLKPYYVTGYADGESSFMISIIKRSKMSTGYEVQISFVIAANHSKDLILAAMLDKIHNFGGVGSICKGTKTIHQYRLSSLKELRLIIKLSRREGISFINPSTLVRS